MVRAPLPPPLRAAFGLGEEMVTGAAEAEPVSSLMVRLEAEGALHGLQGALPKLAAAVRRHLAGADWSSEGCSPLHVPGNEAAQRAVQSALSQAGALRPPGLDARLARDARQAARRVVAPDVPQTALAVLPAGDLAR
eukprot:935106-Prorocentrum_minimum.AAC.1